MSVEVISRDIMYEGREARVDRVRDISERKKALEEKEQLVKQLSEVTEELSDLNQIASISVNVAQPDMAVEALVKNLVVVSRADAGAVLVRGAGVLSIRSAIGSGDKLWGETIQENDLAFPVSIIQENQPIFVGDVQEESLVLRPLKEAGLRTSVGVPIRYGMDVIGLIFLSWKEKRSKNERDIRLLEIAADRCASAIITSRMSERSREADEMGDALSEINSTLGSMLNIGTQNGAR